MAKTKVLYERLNLTETATEEQISNAYIELTKKFAPDSKEYIKLTEAYEVLKDVSLRAKYDVTGKIPNLRNGNKSSVMNAEALMKTRKVLNTVFLIGTLLTAILYILKINGHADVPFFAVGIASLAIKIIEFILRLIF